MPFEELINALKRLYEAETGWGDSRAWANQDFIILSERIHERTGIALSHVTLKRIWGKVKYSSLPNTYTLDTLAQYLGFESWRCFAAVHQNNLIAIDAELSEVHTHIPAVNKQRNLFWLLAPVAVLGVIIAIVALTTRPKDTPAINKNDYKFSSKKVITSGLPNSVIFDYDATKAPGDSVIIQQSWDKNLRATVGKNDKQHTAIYYYPDFYYAKLIVGGRIVKQHELLIKSDGWMAVVGQKPVPVYFDKKDIMLDGKMTLPVKNILDRNVPMQPVQPYTGFCNVTDLGEIYSDDFTFETRVKNNYNEGAAICQQTNIYILCKGTAIGIPLCAKGCVSNVDLIFTDYFKWGKKNDLSASGVDFNNYVDVRIQSHNKKAEVYINNKLAYTITKNITHSKIIGFHYRFQGTGAVDYVRLSNGKVNFDDEF